MTVYVEERQGTPCGGPIEQAEGERKLVDAVRLGHVLRKEVQVTGLGGHAHHRGARQRRADTDCQEIMGGGKRAVETTPCEQEGRVKGRQDPRIERKRTRKHGCKGNTER